MTFDSKRQVPKGAQNNGSSNGHNGTGPHEPAAHEAGEPLPLEKRVSRYIPTPPVPRDHGREDADARAEKQSPKSLRLREHLDCEPPWDILRARASFDNPASPHEPWPDRFDIWPTDMAGYWPCPICATSLAPVDKTPMKLFRCVSCDTETFVHVKAPVVECPLHGRHEIVLPWMENDVKWDYLGLEPVEDAHSAGGSLRDLAEGDFTEDDITEGGETEH
jgi:hypothetical protein